MKMYDKNGRLTIIAKAVFDANMERLRAGDDPLDIAKSMKEQVQLVEYNGPLEKIHDIQKQGWFWYLFTYLAAKEPPRLVGFKLIGATTGRMSSTTPDLKTIPNFFIQSMNQPPITFPEIEGVPHEDIAPDMRVYNLPA